MKYFNNINFLKPKLGYLILTFYLTITYGGGWILSQIFDFTKKYNNFYSYDKTPLLYIPLIVAIVLIFNSFNFFKRHNITSKILCFVEERIFNEKFSIVILFLFLFCSILFWINYGYTFRHTGPNIMLTDYYVIFLFIAKPYLLSLIFREFLLFTRYQLLYSIPKLKITLISFGLFFFLTSAFDVIFILSSVVLLLDNRVKVSIFSSQYSNRESTKIKLLVVLSFSLCMLLIFYVGLSNKSKETVSLSETIFNKKKYEMVAAEYLSNSYAALVILNSKLKDDNALKLEIVQSPLNLLRHRLSIFLGRKSYEEKPVNSSVADYTYQLTRNNISSKSTTGASPGLIGTFVLMPYFPFGFLFLSWILSLFIRLLNTIPNAFSIIGIFYIYLFIYFLFKNPLDYLLNPSNPMVLYLILNVIVLNSYNDKNKR